MRYGSLFTGIGGFDIAAEWCDWETIFQVENNDFCNEILEKRWPNVRRFKDIKEFNGKQFREAIDVISGGLPCQPFSCAGKRKGSGDDRYLWPEMLRVISETGPAFIICENVAGLASMENVTPFEKWLFIGLESKNYLRRIYTRHLYRKRQTFVLNEIIKSLEGENYTVETFIIPACGVGAWHKRDRIWIVGYSDIWSMERGHERYLSKLDENASNPSKCRLQGKQSENKGINRETQTKGSGQTNNAKRSCKDVPDTKISNKGRLSMRKKKKKSGFTFNGKNAANPDNTQATRHRKDSRKIYGKSESKRLNCISENWWTIEPGLGRVAHGIPNRVDRLKALGNAIVPQIAFEFFKIIDKINESN